MVYAREKHKTKRTQSDLHAGNATIADGAENR
jgi:hypothetical protein